MSHREVLLSLVTGYDLGLCQFWKSTNHPSYVLRAFLPEAQVQYWGWLKSNPWGKVILSCWSFLSGLLWGHTALAQFGE